MLKIRSISSVIIVVLILSITLVLPATAQPRGGFLLTGADAAYAWFFAEFEDADLRQCAGELFIGYVKADRLLYFGERGGPNPHSDVEVIFSGECDGDMVVLEGVRGALNHPTWAVMVELETADLYDFPVRLGVFGSDAPVAFVTVAWEAIGDTRTETFHSGESQSAHRTRDANVEAYVFIDSAPVDLTLVPDAIITHYNESNRGSGQ